MRWLDPESPEELPRDFTGEVMEAAARRAGIAGWTRDVDGFVPGLVASWIDQLTERADVFLGHLRIDRKRYPAIDVLRALVSLAVWALAAAF